MNTKPTALKYTNAELAAAFKQSVSKVLTQAAAEGVKRGAERNAKFAAIRLAEAEAKVAAAEAVLREAAAAHAFAFKVNATHANASDDTDESKAARLCLNVARDDREAAETALNIRKSIALRASALHEAALRALNEAK